MVHRLNGTPPLLTNGEKIVVLRVSESRAAGLFVRTLSGPIEVRYPGNDGLFNLIRGEPVAVRPLDQRRQFAV